MNPIAESCDTSATYLSTCLLYSYDTTETN